MANGGYARHYLSATGKAPVAATTAIRYNCRSTPSEIAAGHAWLIIGHVNAQILAEMAVDEGYSMRQLKEWVREDNAKPGGSTFDKQLKKDRANAAKAKDADTRALEKRLSDALGLAVSVDHKGESGTLHIEYKDLDQLDAVLHKLERH